MVLAKGPGVPYRSGISGIPEAPQVLPQELALVLELELLGLRPHCWRNKAHCSRNPGHRQARWRAGRGLGLGYACAVRAAVLLVAGSVCSGSVRARYREGLVSTVNGAGGGTGQRQCRLWKTRARL